jgi:hypothetical protein
MLTPVIILNSSPVTWATDPLPAEAKLTLPCSPTSKDSKGFGRSMPGREPTPSKRAKVEVLPPGNDALKAKLAGVPGRLENFLKGRRDKLATRCVQCQS